ncbi:sulfate transporter [Allomyces macrogynus ATCC 38327]|uniref:Sulfate transporter n=1 Tax=Allomyces macrogynus (strain ATCC 38327) TaxID=578462 RepID=A0A0L0SYT8_ALLM3|nr:sulfate transporter [Allomyces macrogynus ATCC 38327]|eukprot:KNE67723.1 sulfate transporter [Allomyces macrogynus ATCC 38327]
MASYVAASAASDGRKRAASAAARQLSPHAAHRRRIGWRTAVTRVKNASCRAAASTKDAALRVPADLAGSARYFHEHPAQLATDNFAGVAVAIMQSTFWIGLMAGLFGARPDMVSGLAGAMAMVQRGIMIPAADSPLATACPSERMQVLLATMLVVGVFQIVLGLIKAPAALRLLPFPVHVGFTNGLAAVVLVAQLAGFNVDAGPAWILRFDELQLYLVAIFVVLAMIITHFQSRIPGTLRLDPIKLTSQIVPGSLKAMDVTMLVEHLVFRRALGVHAKTVGDVAVIKGEFTAPSWLLVGIDWSKYTGTISSTRPCLGSLTAPFFNCIGGSAMVGQSALTILSGTRSRIAAVTAALLIAVILVAAGPAIALLPVATLSGILFVVVLHAFEWRTLRYIFRREMPWGDVVTVVVVSVLAVAVNLAVVVVVGTAWSAIVYAWRASQDAVVERIGVAEIKEAPAGSEVDPNVGFVEHVLSVVTRHEPSLLRFTGPLFHASTAALVHDLTLTSPPAVVRPETDPPIVLWDLTHAPVRDASAVRDLKAAAKAWTTF